LTTGFGPLESTIYSSCMSIVGDPTYLGLLVLGFFVGFVFLQGTRMDVKIMVIVPALFLAMSFIGILKVIVVVGIGVVMMLGIKKFMNL